MRISSCRIDWRESLLRPKPLVSTGLLRILAFSAALGSMAGLAPLAVARDAPGPFAPLLVYRGTWRVTADHPWSGSAPGAVDRLRSDCKIFHAYFACEQSVNGKPLALIVYTAGDRAGEYHTRTIGPNGLAGGRGTMTIAGKRWTYLDKPAAGLSGPWSRVENVVVSRDRIRFEEYESADEGKTWRLTNQGVEDRIAGARRRG
jgi:hypothetical protein